MNFIQLAKEETTNLIRAAFADAVRAGALPQADGELSFPVEIPKDTAHGDYTSTFPMAAAKTLHMAPRKIAEQITQRITLSGSFFDSVEIAGAGFINFRLG